MVIAMAVFVFCSVIFLGAVNPSLAFVGISVLGCAGLIWLGGQFLQEEVTLAWSRIDLAVGIFVAYAAVRYTLTPVEYEARLEMIQVICCGAAYFLSSKGIRERDARRLFVWLVAVFALFQSGLGIWQALTKSDFIFNWERPELYNGRGSGTFVCPNHLAGFLEMSLGLIVARAAIVRKEGGSVERSILVKLVLVYVAIMVAMGLITSMSRAGWVAAAIGLVAVLFMGGWQGRQNWLRIVVVMVVLACTAAAFWSFEPVRNYLLRTVAAEGGDQAVALSDPTLGGRTMMWSGTIDMIRQNPLLGTGMGTWQWHYQKVKDYRILSVPDYTHNDYLNLASDYGMLGVFLMSLVFVAFFRHAFKILAGAKSSEDKAFVVGGVSAVVAILIHSWFDFNLHIFGNAVFLATIMGITVGIPLPGSHSRSAAGWQRVAAGVGVLCLFGSIAYLFVPTLRAFHLARKGDEASYDLKYDEAVQHYSDAIRMDPRSPKPLIRQGDIFRDQLAWRVGPGKLRERRDLAAKAVEAYDRALQLNPYLSDVWVSRGRVLELVGTNAEALASYLKAIDVAPVNAYAHFILGQFYREQGESQKAVEAFEKADRYFLFNDPMFQMSQWYEREKLNAAPKIEQTPKENVISNPPTVK